MTTSLYNYGIGLASDSIENIEELAVPIPAPSSTYKPYQDLIALGDLTTRGVGTPSAEWRWSFISNAQRDHLRSTYCTGSSADIYIRMPVNDNDDEYVEFSATVIWPLEEDPSNGHKLDFVLKFVNLVEVPAP